MTTADSTGGAAPVVPAVTNHVTVITSAALPIAAESGAAAPPLSRPPSQAGSAAGTSSDSTPAPTAPLPPPPSLSPPPSPAQGSNPGAAPLTGGAGPFITEAPYWTSSALVSNPDAGAGQFHSDTNAR